MNEDKLYAFVMRGELTKTALENTDVISRHSSSEILSKEYVRSLSLDLLDEEYVNAAKEMATVYTAIAAFENGVRRFVTKILIENKGENFKLCGFWKVYGSEEKAIRTFSNYQKCRKFLCGKLNDGIDIYKALKIS